MSDSGLGGYVVLPLSWLDFEDDPFDVLEDDELAVGNLEAGGMYAMPLGRTGDMIFHGGVAFGTADDDGPGASQYLAALPRFTDLAHRIPNATWLRLGFSPMGTAGIMFWRFDLGADLMIDDDDGAAAEIDPILRINAAVGVDLGAADLSAELVNNVLDTDDDDDDALHTFAIGARFAADKVQPGLALILPIDFDDLDALEAAIAVSLTARID